MTHTMERHVILSWYPFFDVSGILHSEVLATDLYDQSASVQKEKDGKVD